MDIEDDILVNVILPSLKTEDLLNLRSTNKRFNDLYNREDFWKQRVQKDFPNEDYREGRTWKEYYKYLSTPRKIGNHGNSHIFSKPLLFQADQISTLIGEWYKRKYNGYRSVVIFMDSNFKPVVVFEQPSLVGIRYSNKEIKSVLNLTHPIEHSLDYIINTRYQFLSPYVTLSFYGEPRFHYHQTSHDLETEIDAERKIVKEEILRALHIRHTTNFTFEGLAEMLIKAAKEACMLFYEKED